MEEQEQDNWYSKGLMVCQSINQSIVLRVSQGRSANTVLEQNVTFCLTAWEIQA
jgi:hypothetical protein